MAARDLAAARSAYEVKSPEASIQAHTQPNCEPGHSGENDGEIWRCALSGGFEGAVAATVVIAAGTAAQLDTAAILTLAISCVVSLAVACVVKEYLRGEAEREHFAHEQARELWELRNFKAGEINEMIELYTSKGMSHEDAQHVVQTMAKYEAFFVSTMMAQELNLAVPKPTFVGLTFASGIAFFVFGVGTIVVYAAFHAAVTSFQAPAVLSTVSDTATIVTLLTAIWTTLIWFVAKRHLLRKPSGLQLLITFLTCCTLGFVTQQVTQHATPLCMQLCKHYLNL